jgi:hypothetical protein
MYASPASTPVQVYDVVIAGAGTGGTSAAIQAARLGANVALLDETDWIGGQMAAAAVGSMDEGTAFGSTPPSGIYAEFMHRMAVFYNAHGKTVGTCYYEVSSHCYDPSAIRQILNEMIADVNSGKDNKTHGHIDLYLQDRVVRVLTTGQLVTGVVTAQNRTLHSKILIDATEYGDVIPLTPARYRMSYTIGQDKQALCTQFITWTTVIRKYPLGVPPELQTHNPPPNYEHWAAKFRSELRLDGNENKKVPVNFAGHNGYRAFPDLANPVNYNALQREQITRTGVNWFNDFPVTTEIFDRDKRKHIICQAKLKTLANVYYIQHEMKEPLWSVANDEGFDSAYNKQNSCPEIPEEYKALEYNMPPSPYIRESIRIIGEYTLTAGDIKREGNWSKSIRSFPDAIAVGDYADDLHGCNIQADLEQDLENISDQPGGFKMGPFQVPLRSLIPEKVDGLLAAEKNISQTRLTNGATRLQPITMLTGEAVGTLAGLAVAEHVQPRLVAAEDVQATLVQFGSILIREHVRDLTLGSKAWQAAQFAAVRGWITADESNIAPHKQINRADAARILADAYLKSAQGSDGTAHVPAHTGKPSYADVTPGNSGYNGIEALRAAGAVSHCQQSTETFCPDEPMSLGKFVHAVAVLGSHRSGAISPQGEAILHTGVVGIDDQPLTNEDAAMVLYNSAVMTIWQRKHLPSM